MRVSVIGCAAIGLALAVGGRAASAECAHTATREAATGVAGAAGARIEARQGSLRVTGRPGLQEIWATGTACASSQELLGRIQLVAERSGDEVRVRVVIPEVDGRQSAKLDLVVEVPDTLPLVVEDSSGDTEITQVAATEVYDSSGDLAIQEIRGDLRVDDSSGSIEVRDVGGHVWVSDSSGDIDIRRAGSVEIERDSSGQIDASDVRGDVLVRRDSSGSIRADRVGGDFIVERDGSGDIDHSEIAGLVKTPQ